MLLGWKKQVTLPTLRRWFGANEGNSYAVSIGTPIENRNYCKKDGIFTEFGDIPESKATKGGKATADKWKEIADLAVKKHMLLLRENHPKEFVSNYRNLKQIGFDFNKTPADLDEPCGIWYHGKSGVGKSYRARHNFPGLYQKMFNKWWDNYDGEEFVLLDDMDHRYSESMHYFLKIWADEYAFRAEVKNHSFMIRPRKIIVTSQYHPRDLWTKPEDFDAIKRRFTCIEIVGMEEYDAQEVIAKSKKRKFDLSGKFDEPAKKKPYKQDSDGIIVENTNPCIQRKIDFELLKSEEICISDESDNDSDSNDCDDSDSTDGDCSDESSD